MLRKFPRRGGGVHGSNVMATRNGPVLSWVAWKSILRTAMSGRGVSQALFKRRILLPARRLLTLVPVQAKAKVLFVSLGFSHQSARSRSREAQNLSALSRLWVLEFVDLLRNLRADFQDLRIVRCKLHSSAAVEIGFVRPSGVYVFRLGQHFAGKSCKSQSVSRR